jgi:hypothetical protein
MINNSLIPPNSLSDNSSPLPFRRSGVQEREEGKFCKSICKEVEECELWLSIVVPEKMVIRLE